MGKKSDNLAQGTTTKKLDDVLDDLSARARINQKQQWPSADSTMCLKIDFQKRPEIYDAIMQAAEDELRTPEMQALYWLTNR